MSDKKPRERLDLLCYQAVVPAGFDPRSDAEIERMLAALGGESPADRTERILAKVLGNRPLVWEETIATSDVTESSDFEAAEFAEMFRAPGEPLSKEQEEKLRAMEMRAMEESAEDDEAADQEDGRNDGDESK